MDINILIAKLLLHNINRQEMEALQKWLSQSPSNRLYLEEIEGIYQALEVLKNPDKIDPEEAWKAIENKLSVKTDYRDQILNKAPTRRFIDHKKWIVAASFILAISFSFTGGYLFFLNKDKSVIAYNEINVPKGSKSMITLSDGSKIWLNSSTYLKYPEKFEPTQREVFLEGEAYFEITKDKNKPFYVRTSDLDIKVLGTSFNVKSYANEGTIETTLESGSISIVKKLEGKKEKKLLLTPNQRLTFVKSEGKITVDDIKDIIEENKDVSVKTEHRSEKMYLSKNINTKLYTSWKDNKLVFKDESFESLVVKIERWYNVKIIIQGEELKQFRFNGTFENETLEQALKALQITTNFKYSIDKNIVTIKYD